MRLLQPDSSTMRGLLLGGRMPHICVGSGSLACHAGAAAVIRRAGAHVGVPIPCLSVRKFRYGYSSYYCVLQCFPVEDVNRRRRATAMRFFGAPRDWTWCCR